MSQPYVGEIRCFGFNFAPVDWAQCNGQLLSIAQYQALYAVMGTTYGGDGQSTFALPNLQGRAPMHPGNPGSGPAVGFTTIIGQILGNPSVTLTVAQTPAHTHSFTAQAIGSGGVVERTATPGANTWLSDSAADGIYQDTPTLNAQFSPRTITQVGGSQPHENMQPYLAVNFCISLYGVFPSQN